MKNKVCMFIWETSVENTRVLRECTALSDEGYHVDLICVRNPNERKLPKYQKYNNNFRIFRVRTEPIFLLILQAIYSYIKRYKTLAFAVIYLVALFLYAFPLQVSFMLLSMFLLLKFPSMLINLNVFIRMLVRGTLRDYDVYHSHNPNTLALGYIASKLRLKKRKLVYDLHEIKQESDKRQIKKAELVFVNNDTRAKYIEEQYGIQPKVIKDYPFKPQELKGLAPIREILGLPIGERILMYHGDVEVGKGIDKLILASEHFKGGALVIIGDGGQYKTELMKIVKDNNLDHKVKFLPSVPIVEHHKYLANAYLGFQVPNNEPFNHYSESLSYDYMLSGIPVIAADLPEIREVVDKEKIGILVNSNDHMMIAERVNFLLSNPNLRDEYILNCKKARVKYDWEQEKESFLEIYSSVLN